MRATIGALSTTLLLAASEAAAQRRGIVPEDEYRVVTVGEVAVAPAGDRVAFTVTRVIEQENKRHRSIWMQRLVNGQPQGEPFRLTDPSNDAWGPRWSPDGSVLAFSSSRGKDPNTTWFTRASSTGGEAYHVDGIEGAPTWSSDGKWIAQFRAPGNEGDPKARSPRAGWIAPDAISKTADSTRFDGRVITHIRYKADGIFALLPHPSARPKLQLFVHPAGCALGSPPRRRAGGCAAGRQLTRYPFGVSNGVWAPDGRALFFAGNAKEDDQYVDEPTGDLFVVSVDGGEPRQLTSGPGSNRSPAVSPDGKKLVYLHTLKRGAPTNLMIVDLAPDGRFAGSPRQLTPGWDLIPADPSWSRDGRSIRFTADVGGDTHLLEVAVGGGKPRQITSGTRELGSLSASKDGAVMAFTASTVTTPAEVYVAGRDGRDERKLTSFNDAWLAGVERVPAERLTWKVSDGTPVDGWVLKPVGYQPGRKHPMVLVIHGGPHGAFGNGFSSQHQMLAGAGFFVLYINPRGSTGYGNAFTYATAGKWGEMDREDLELGMQAAFARYPDIDQARVGVTGGSYGGFMTNWMTATSKQRFAAAVTRSSITEWMTQYTSSDTYGNKTFEFLGEPWEQRELYTRLSPITYVEKVTAPTLIIHGEHDYRTPIAHAEQWYLALKRNRVPVEFARYPRSAHAIREPWLQVDAAERTRSWFVHWLIERPTAPVGSR